MSDHTTEPIEYKTCSKCGEHKPATAEYFYPYSHGRWPGKFFAACRICSHKQYRERYANLYKKTVRLNEQRRQAKKRALPATLTRSEWEDLLADYHYSCAYCGKVWFEVEGALQQDHVIPLSKGGGYTKDNIVPACRSCNLRKGARTPIECGMTLAKPMLDNNKHS